MSAVLARISQVASEHGMLRSRRMWLPEMNERIYLRDLSFFPLRCAG